MLGAVAVRPGRWGHLREHPRALLPPYPSMAITQVHGEGFEGGGGKVGRSRGEGKPPSVSAVWTGQPASLVMLPVSQFTSIFCKSRSPGGGGEARTPWLRRGEGALRGGVRLWGQLPRLLCSRWHTDSSVKDSCWGNVLRIKHRGTEVPSSTK